MAQFLFLCLLLVNAFLGLAMATHRPQIMVQSISAPSSYPPAESPSSGQRTHTVETPIVRKLGWHQHKHVSSSGSGTGTPCPSPSEAPQSEKKLHSRTEGSIPSHQRTSVEPQNEEFLGIHGTAHLLKQHHHSYDKSIAGAGVIVGGLATTFLVAVFCYMRATARHKPDPTS